MLIGPEKARTFVLFSFAVSGAISLKYPITPAFKANNQASLETLSVLISKTGVQIVSSKSRPCVYGIFVRGYEKLVLESLKLIRRALTNQALLSTRATLEKRVSIFTFLLIIMDDPLPL